MIFSYLFSLFALLFDSDLFDFFYSFINDDYFY